MLRGVILFRQPVLRNKKKEKNIALVCGADPVGG